MKNLSMNMQAISKEFFMKRSLGFLTALSVIIFSASASAQQQPGTQTPGTAAPQTGNPQQVNWSEELKNAQEEKRALTSILSAIESIDTARQHELIQWIITDRSVRSRVISALRKAGKT